MQDVLPITCAELQSPEQLNQVRVQALDVRFIGDTFAFFAHDHVEFLLGFLNDFFDARGVNATVFEQLAQRQARYFTADRIMTRQCHRVWGIVDDNVDAGNLFKGADIAAFTSDDASFDFFGRQWNGRYRDFGDII